MSDNETIARIGHGILFKLWDDEASPPGYVSVGQVVDLTPPALGRAMVDASHSESEDADEEKIPGRGTKGDVTVTLHFDGGSDWTDYFYESRRLRRAEKWRIEFPDGDAESSPEITPSRLSCDVSYLSNVEPGTPLDDKMTLAITFGNSAKIPFFKRGTPWTP